MKATSLPLPYCFIGYVFIAQSETPEGPKFFCACTRRAIEHCVNNSLSEKEHRRATTALRPATICDFVLDHHFPTEFSMEMFDSGISNERVLEALTYRDNICHKCNLAVPPYENV
jgi:hypothetical protein